MATRNASGRCKTCRRVLNTTWRAYCKSCLPANRKPKVARDQVIESRKEQRPMTSEEVDRIVDRADAKTWNLPGYRFSDLEDLARRAGLIP